MVIENEEELEERESVLYEQTVRVLAEKLHASLSDDPIVKVRSGSTCKVQGMSSQEHQIDVLIEDRTYVFIIECKSWGKPVSLPALLTHLGRWVDIQPMVSMTKGKKTVPIIVTTVGFQRGAITVAEYYQIELWRVTSPEDFALRFKNRAFNSLAVKAMIGPPISDGAQPDTAAYVPPDSLA